MIQPPEDTFDISWMEETLDSMSLEEKVGQVFFPTMMDEHLTSEEQMEEYSERILDEILTYAPGGYYLNRYYWQTTPHLLDVMQKSSRTPLIIASDMESGAGSGLGGIIAPQMAAFPPAMAIGATDFDLYAYWVSYFTAIQARALGVNMIFAPVLDVNNNPQNPIINVRSYGEDPQQVIRYARASLNGFREGGVLSCGKHFPGHGDTSEDSHLHLNRLEVSRERLEAVELLPYRTLISEDQLDAIMTAHIAVPALDPTPDTPATASGKILTDLLRREMDFPGLIITDALLMGGITTVRDTAEASIQSLEAGADVLLMPPDFPTAWKGLLKAVQSGRISEDRLDESVWRILLSKGALNLQENRSSMKEYLPIILKDAEPDSLCMNMCGDAVTLVSCQDEALPLRYEDPVAAITFFDAVDDFFDEGEDWHEALQNRSDFIDPYTMTPDSDAEDMAQAYRMIEQNETILFAAVINVLPDKGSVAFPEMMEQLIRHTLGQQKRCVLVVFGSPYVLARYEEVSVRVCSYGYLPPMCEVTAEVLFGERKPGGRLPVTLG